MLIADAPDDRVTLKFDGRDLLIAEQYEIRMGLLAQPCAFSLTLGSPAISGPLLSRFPVGSEFELSVGGRVQFSGIVDEADVDDGSGTRAVLRGRDKLAQLVDTEARDEEGFGNLTVRELTEKVLDRAMMGQGWELVYGDDAGRQLRSGAPARAGGGGAYTASAALGNPAAGTSAAAAAAAVASLAAAAAGVAVAGATPSVAIEKATQQAGKPAAKVVQVKLGQKYWDGVLKPEFARKGLFLVASADGPFAIIKPAAKQAPVARIVRTPARSGVPGTGRVIRGSLRNDTSGRHTVYEVHGRSGGGSKARKKMRGIYVDREMFDLGFRKVCCRKDDKASDLEACEQHARRLCAEARRAGWVLTYELAGHTWEAIDGNGRITWTYDTTVEVIDDILGVAGTFYIESVAFSRGPETKTRIRLMRPEDVLFGEEADGERIGPIAATPPSATRGVLPTPISTIRDALAAGFGLEV